MKTEWLFGKWFQRERNGFNEKPSEKKWQNMLLIVCLGFSYCIDSEDIHLLWTLKHKKAVEVIVLLEIEYSKLSLFQHLWWL